MTWLLIRLGVRLVVFTGVFWLATRPRVKKPQAGAGGAKDGKPTVKPARISIQPRWAIPIVGVLFAALNTALYWAVRPVLDLATLKTLSFFMPFVVNALLLWGTVRIVSRKEWIKVDGLLAGAWLAGALTLAHGALYVGLDYLPTL